MIVYELNRSFNPGDRDKFFSHYTHVRVISLICDQRSVTARVEMGGIVDGEFSAGSDTVKTIVIRDQPRASPPGTAYSDLKDTMDPFLDDVVNSIGLMDPDYTRK